MKIIFVIHVPESFNLSTYYSTRLCTINAIYSVHKIDYEGDVRLLGPTAFYLTCNDFRKYLREGIIKVIKE